MIDVDKFKTHIEKYFDKPKQAFDFSSVHEITNIPELDNVFLGMDINYFVFRVNKYKKIDNYSILFIHNKITDFYIPACYFFNQLKNEFSVYLSFIYRQNSKSGIFREYDSFVLKAENKIEYLKKLISSLPSIYQNILFSEQLMSYGYIGEKGYFLNLFIDVDWNEIRFDSGLKGKNGFVERLDANCDYNNKLYEFLYQLKFYKKRLNSIITDLSDLFDIAYVKEFKEHSFADILNSFYGIDLYTKDSFSYPLNMNSIFSEDSDFQAVINMYSC